MGVRMVEQLPDASSVDGVDEVIDYQSNDADKSVLMKGEYGVQQFRVHYLNYLRDSWEWVDDSKKGKPFVLLKRR